MLLTVYFGKLEMGLSFARLVTTVKCRYAFRLNDYVYVVCGASE